MAKVTLSNFELELLQNSEFILTKNNIITKVYEQFGVVCENYRQLIQQNDVLPAEVFSISPKISKGENYKNLPWVMLDFARWYKAENIFAIRCFFWWANHFSFHLYVNGQYRNAIQQRIEKEKKLSNEWFICVNKQTPWEYDFTPANYLPLQHFSKEKYNDLTHFKIGTYMPLNKWNNAEHFYTNSLETILKVVG